MSLSDEERLQRKRESQRKYREKKRLESGKEPRTFYTPEEATERIRLRNKAYMSRRRQENPEAVKAIENKYKKNNPELVKAKTLKWRVANLEKYQEQRRKNRENTKAARASYSKKYLKSHPEKYQRASSRRRARLQNVASEPYTISEVLFTHGTTCHLCGLEINLTAPRHISKGAG